MSDKQRDDTIEFFKAGKFRALVNYKMLTTGFNHPAIDLIIDLYPTISPGMHVQKYGRGTRPFKCNMYVKENCLVLDYSGNTRRLGPIDDPLIPNPKSSIKGTAPIKTCDSCNTYNHISVTHCVGCGTPFSFKVKIKETASEIAVMSSSQPEIHMYDVSHIVHNLHTKEHTPDMVKITYLCPQGGSFSEFLCPEHNSFAKHKAHEWWCQRHNSEPPKTTREWLNQLSQLRIPAKIRVWSNKKYPEILGYEF
jgi:DNA repair protein RadD